MRKVGNALLVYVPSRWGFREGGVPLGLLYVGNILEKLGINVKIFDFYLYNLLKEDKYGYGKLKDIINTFNPDILGFGGIATSYTWTKELSKRVKDDYPEIVQTAGGTLSSIDEILLTKTGIDVVFHGEAERTLPLFIEELNEGATYQKVPGISYLEGGEIKRNRPAVQLENLDILPLPSYHLVDLEDYITSRQEFLDTYKDDLISQGLYENVMEKLKNARRFLPIFTARGCLYHCSFCYRHLSGYRKHSVDYVIKHIKFLMGKFHIDGFAFLDELFTADTDWVMRFCDAIKSNNLKIAYRIHGARVDKVSEEMLRRLAETGCFNINYGQESGSNKILKEYKKGIFREQNVRATLLTRKYGIYSTVQLVIGSPGETRGTILETVDFLKEVNARFFSLNYLIPFPGTPIWNYVKENNLIKDIEGYLGRVAKYGGAALVNLTNVPDREWRGWYSLIRYKVDLYHARRTGSYIAYVKIAVKEQLKKMLPERLKKILRRCLSYKKDKTSYIVVFGNGRLGNLYLILRCWIRNIQMLVITFGPSSPRLDSFKRMPLVKNYIKKSLKVYNSYLVDYKDLWYALNKETVDLTIEFYNKELKVKNKIINYYNKILNSDKFEAYIKHETSFDVFCVLKNLHFIRLYPNLKEINILINRTPLSEFIVRYVEKKYRVTYKIKWLSPIPEPYGLFAYYIWLSGEFVKRGVVFSKKRKTYKLSQEAAWGFYRKTLRNDIMIDHKKFNPENILMLRFCTDEHADRGRAFREVQKRGYDNASVAKLKININENIFHILFFFFFVPLKFYLQLFLKRHLHFFCYIIFFHKKCFPIEILMNSYHIKCNISMYNGGDIAETIILNKYGTKNIIFHWSDINCHMYYRNAFIAHNIHYVWGDVFNWHFADTHHIDEKKKVGCIYKREINKALADKENILSRINDIKKERKIVMFFSNSFHSAPFRYNERTFLEFMGMMEEFCEKNTIVNVMIKPKGKEYRNPGILEGGFLRQYEEIRKSLSHCDNFFYLFPLKWTIEDAIAISDVCVTMGMATPSTIALVCGKNAFYFNNTGDVDHPFVKRYKNVIVFDKKENLFKQIDNVLKGTFNCQDIITEKEIRKSDAFDDDNALERIRHNLYELTSSD